MNNQVYEVDLIDLCRAVFKRWKLLVLCTVLFGAVGAGLSVANQLRIPPRHCEPVPQHWCGNLPPDKRGSWYKKKIPAAV